MKGNRSGFTLPAEVGMEEEIMKLAEKWGVDAVRDSDGTALSRDILDMGFVVYSTLCLIRHDNQWAKRHSECLQHIYLMSEPCCAFQDALTIDIMEDYFAEQVVPAAYDNIKKLWAVVNRTTGETHDEKHWEYDEATQQVIITNARKFHEYYVIFMAKQIWEPVSMYNHLTNNWTEEHRLPVDVRYREAREHILKVLADWLKEHPKTDVVRFTTFFYNFDLIYNKRGKERRVDWFGYLSCVSPLALEQFRMEYGYELTPRDFVQDGYYNNPFVNPTKKQLDWMDFNQRFVSEFARQCVEMVHASGKKAIMFLGDHWAGTEPYGKYFASIGLDAVVGAAGDGVTTRMIADIPIAETEARFYPYFFPDVFHEGGDPAALSREIWWKCRRAILQKPMKRMGYGGYLSLALKFPDFVEHVQDVSKQFRLIWENSKGKIPYKAAVKVAVLNSWGRIRTWQTHQVAHSLWNQKCYSYLGIFEALSGLPVELEFISFDDIRRHGIKEDVKVIINAGDAYTSWSGGENWKDPRVIESLREWVAHGGGFIGVGDPTAYEYNGAFFQLWDVMGVQKEIGFTLNNNKPGYTVDRRHFIMEDMGDNDSFHSGEPIGMIYKAGKDTWVLAEKDNSITMAANSYGKGRSVYLAGLPFSLVNTRLLLRALFWSARQEEAMYNYFSSNPNTECTYFPQSQCMAVVNNSSSTQRTTIYMPGSVKEDFTLAPLELKWK